MNEIPNYVKLIVVVKGRDQSAILEAIDAGTKNIGENYIQDAEIARAIVNKNIQWHFIGHLQRNKVKKAISLFNIIETVDSLQLAVDIETQCEKMAIDIPVLIEVNSGRELQKSGLLPEQVKTVISHISQLHHVRVVGLMTMGPSVNDPDEARPFFRNTRRLFESIQESQIAGVEMKFLSMGMSNSYKVAIQEGANMVRIGRMIFDETKK